MFPSKRLSMTQDKVCNVSNAFFQFLSTSKLIFCIAVSSTLVVFKKATVAHKTWRKIFKDENVTSKIIEQSVKKGEKLLTRFWNNSAYLLFFCFKGRHCSFELWSSQIDDLSLGFRVYGQAKERVFSPPPFSTHLVSLSSLRVSYYSLKQIPFVTVRPKFMAISETPKKRAQIKVCFFTAKATAVPQKFLFKLNEQNINFSFTSWSSGSKRRVGFDIFSIFEKNLRSFCCLLCTFISDWKVGKYQVY